MTVANTTAAPNPGIYDNYSPSDIYTEITKCTSQAKAIVDLIGRSEEVDTFSRDNASWAVKDLLSKVDELAESLEDRASNPKEVAA